MTPDSSWIGRFNDLAGLEPSVRETLAHASIEVRAPKGTCLFGPGQAPQGYILLLEGDIRVSQVADNGREIVLYRVLPGESCALTTACLLSGDTYQAEAHAETDIVAVAVPRATFSALISQSLVFRTFVLAAFSRRVTDLFKLVDEIAFHRMDVRLANKLLELAGPAAAVNATHQQIASELGTAREVVSRLINEFQRRGWVQSARGTVTLTDRAALERLSRTP